MNKKPYKLYTDKAKDFTCQLHLEGIPLKNTNVRMVIESKDTSLSFGGTVNKHGKCIIPIHALGNKLGKVGGGLMRLEVFAGDVFFQPWKSSFIINGRKFDESININASSELIENSFEVDIIKQDIKELSEKVSKLSTNKEEKYTDSVKKWSNPTLNLNEIKKDNNKSLEVNEILNKSHLNINEENKENEYKDKIKKWSVVNLNETKLTKKIDVKDKEENYEDIVDKWGATNDDDFQI